MPELRLRDPRLPSYQRFSLSVPAALFLCSVNPLYAQDTTRTAAVWAETATEYIRTDPSVTVTRVPGL